MNKDKNFSNAEVKSLSKKVEQILINRDTERLNKLSVESVEGAVERLSKSLKNTTWCAKGYEFKEEEE